MRFKVRKGAALNGDRDGEDIPGAWKTKDKRLIPKATERKGHVEIY